MKKILLALGVLVSLLVAIPPYFLGFSIWHIGSAVEVATGLGAKIACSARFISEFDEKQSLEDVVSYSPAASLLDMTYNYQQKTVHAELFGMAPTSAQYRKGLGCTLNVADTEHLNQVNVPHVTITSEPWPKGNHVSTLDSSVQSTVNNVLISDNKHGYQTRALLVVKDQNIIAESYADGIDQSTALMGWSMGKSLTAMLIGRYLYIEGTENTDVNFAAWQKDDRQSIKIEHLLQMTSGLAFDETYAPGSDATDMLFTAPSASDVAMKSPLIHEPSTHFSYSSGTTNLLNRWLFEKTGGTAQDLVDFTYKQLFQPLYMSNTIFEPDASGVFVGSSYIYASARDWARLGLLMKNGGKINGQRVLAEDWVKRATTPNNSKNEKAYGYQFWLNEGDETLRWPALPKDAYAMQGNRSQRVMIIPSEDLVIVRLGWSAKGYPTEDNFTTIMTASQ